MKGLIDRLFLLVIGIFAVCLADISVTATVVSVLIMFVCFSLSDYFEDRRGELFVELLYGLIILFFDGGVPIFMLLTYESATGIFKKKYKSLLVLLGTMFLYVVLIFSGRKYYFIDAVSKNLWILLLLAFGVLLSVYFSYSTVKTNVLQREKLKMRDDNEEVIRLERARQSLMVQNQDAEIQMATLKERNRIAREIHDNVGHLLSRCILQLGAVIMIHKNEPVAEELKAVKVGLDESMTSIRSSVHNLHNESLDLKKNIEKIFSDNDDIKVLFEYDVNNDFSMKLKYCIISIVTEAWQNIKKHSNANNVHLIIREHPGIYQLIIHDNGTNVVLKESGIGLHNMEERVREFGGTISFTTDNGFRIFVSIPKEVG